MKRIGFALTFGLLCSILLGPPAQAAPGPYLGCKWSHRVVKYFNAATTVYENRFDGAAAWWNASLVNASLSRVTNAGDRDLASVQVAYGSTSWSGFTGQIDAYGALSLPGCNSNGYWIPKEMTVYLNTTVINPPGTVDDYTITEVKGVAAHEFGHAFGLAHNFAGTICGGTTVPASLMYPYDTRFSTDCPIYQPTDLDVGNVDVLYN